MYRRVKRAVDKGVSLGSLRLKGLEKKVEGRVVRIREGSAQLDRDSSLRIAVAAKVDGVYTNRKIFFIKMKRGGISGFAKAGTADGAERVAAVIKALTGMRSTVVHINNTYVLRCNERHLRTLVRYAEFADYVERWVEGWTASKS